MNLPRVKVFCFFYNEEMLAQFFVRHYNWVDCIHAFVSKSQDATLEILTAAPNVVIEDFEFPNGQFDDYIKRDKLNHSILNYQHDFDWFIAVDADEFVFPLISTPKNLDELSGFISRLLDPMFPKEVLGSIPASETVVRARMWNVFRHETDEELNPNLEPVVLQRRHGDADLNSGGNALYNKPCIIRANKGFQFAPGNHGLLPNPHTRVSFTEFRGAHWQNADPSFCINRRIRDRQKRLSPSNRKDGLGSQHFHVTEQEILALCESHKKDPLCF